MDRRLWLALNGAPGIGPVRFHRILKAFGSLDKAVGAGATGLAGKVSGIDAAQAGSVLRWIEEFDVEREIGLMRGLDARAVFFDDPDYPRNLLPLYDPPPVLYVRGALPDEGLRCIAVVGTRTPTPYGLRSCHDLVLGLAEAGLGIVSGLAKGIDTAAHGAALEAGAPTFAVLGSGLNALYPAENKGLADRISAEGGGLISQFPLDATPDKRRFPMRNGVISGLSAAVLVVEGEEDSGSLITAEWALNQGRDIFAVPGPVDSRFSRGPNRLIQQGAKLVLDAADVMSEFPDFVPKAPLPRVKARAQADPSAAQVGLFEEPKRAPEDLNGEEMRIFQELRRSGRCAMDTLAQKTGTSPAELSATLTMLEIKGAIRQLPGTLVEAL
ncbi:MAG: DNA-processing protein DprA [candidate division FCPU426 bacterium]